jgi:hypothetical protein
MKGRQPARMAQRVRAALQDSERRLPAKDRRTDVENSWPHVSHDH